MSFQLYIDQLNSEGIAVIPNFLNPNQINSCQSEIAKLIEQFDCSTNRSVFTAGKNQTTDKYFLDSVDRISFFFEKDAFDEKNDLIVPKTESINKIGHCLHMKSDVFKQITFSDKVKSLIRELGYIQPKVAQSMYIFKNGKIGGPVVPHKDASFLFTKPNVDLVGLWFPMVDVNLKNGCLSYVPKSHLTSKRRLFVRDESQQNATTCKFIDDDQEMIYSDAEYVPVEVESGSCVLIHGLVVHQSKKNVTDHARPVYTFHILDMHNRQLDERNWLRESTDYKFPQLYEN